MRDPDRQLSLRVGPSYEADGNKVAASTHAVAAAASELRIPNFLQQQLQQLCGCSSSSSSSSREAGRRRRREREEREIGYTEKISLTEGIFSAPTNEKKKYTHLSRSTAAGFFFSSPAPPQQQKGRVCCFFKERYLERERGRGRILTAVASGKRLPSSDSGAFADWVASSTARPDDLCLGFNAAAGGGGASTSSSAGTAAGVPPPAAGAGGGLWSSSRSLNYGGISEMGMVGHLRDVLVVAPASSFHHQQQQQHHHHHHHEQFLAEQAAAAASLNAAAAAAHNSAAATTLGVGVIPLLTAAPCIEDEQDGSSSRRIGGMHLWQNPLQGHPNYLKKSMIDHPGEANAELLPGNNSSGGIGGGPSTCQDCGNQAKKDCSHRRCRTCCKSRGFDCSTHVKSTWVPAARRRERQLASATATAAGSSASNSSAKKPRLISPSQALTSASHTSTSNTTPPRSFDTTSSHQDASFRENLPGHVRAPAVFKCVRVTAVENGDDEYAYQAIVKIGGRVFKGFLYDQGEEGRDGIPNISDLHLGGPGVASKNEAASSFPLLDPSDVYAASGGGMLGGTTYNNPIN